MSAMDAMHEEFKLAIAESQVAVAAVAAHFGKLGYGCHWPPLDVPEHFKVRRDGEDNGDLYIQTTDGADWLHVEVKHNRKKAFTPEDFYPVMSLCPEREYERFNPVPWMFVQVSLDYRWLAMAQPAKVGTVPARPGVHPITKQTRPIVGVKPEHVQFRRVPWDS